MEQNFRVPSEKKQKEKKADWGLTFILVKFSNNL
jgi:hypothetical protein